MTVKKHRLLLGAHMSIAGGLEKSLERGSSIGCTTLQIFTKSNRQWYAKPLSQEAATLFKKTAHDLNINPTVAHATYLINIASDTSKTEHASCKALAQELMVCQELNIPYLVLHPGSSKKPTEGLEKIVRNIDAIFETTQTTTMLLLELMAGQGSTLGTSFEQLATMINKSHYKKRLGVCFDTCHAFATGYDFRTAATYEKMWKEFDKIIGLEKLKVIHINDSKKELGSHVDRHEHIGHGKLGLEPFKLLFNDPRFFDIPKILETPKATKEPFTEDKKNMATIHSLLSKKTRKILNC